MPYCQKNYAKVTQEIFYLKHNVLNKIISLHQLGGSSAGFIFPIELIKRRDY